MTQYEVNALAKCPVSVLADLYNALEDVKEIPLNHKEWTRNDISGAEMIQVQILGILFPGEYYDVRKKMRIGYCKGMYALWDDGHPAECLLDDSHDDRRKDNPAIQLKENCE